jgi:predicted amidohydrolase
MVVAPWGEVVAEAGDSGGVVIAQVDTAKVEEARAMVPALRHDRTLRSPKPVSVGRASG